MLAVVVVPSPLIRCARDGAPPLDRTVQPSRAISFIPRTPQSSSSTAWVVVLELYSPGVVTALRNSVKGSVEI